MKVSCLPRTGFSFKILSPEIREWLLNYNFDVLSRIFIYRRNVNYSTHKDFISSCNIKYR